MILEAVPVTFRGHRCEQIDTNRASRDYAEALALTLELQRWRSSLINLTYSTTGFSSPACVGSTLGRRKFRPPLGL